MAEPLNIQLAREWLAALDNAERTEDGRYIPQMGDAKPMTARELAIAAQVAINVIQSAEA